MRREGLYCAPYGIANTDTERTQRLLSTSMPILKYLILLVGAQGLEPWTR